MLSLRRYVVYIGFAACFLFMLTYFHKPIIANARIPYGPARRPSTTQKSNKGVLELSDPDFRWDKVPTRYPVESLTPLPTGKPVQLPKVQHTFPAETSQQAAKRKKRQKAVKDTFERCWKAYKKHAWMKDELAPLSGGYRDGFGGWAANLVDNLDTLWMMGLKSEFEDAVKAAITLDIRKVTTEQINVFETTIRHLGGFLAAYDLSGDERLLEKAKEFGAMLIKAFDTPNHMPVTRWSPQAALEENQIASQATLLAEIGSLTMEFTRLSQLTGDCKWYDAVNRIVRLLDKQQFKTFLPGMWPVTANAQAADFTRDSLFTLSAMSDSVYEYFPKMHALLGGVDPVYKKLYEGSMATAIEYNLWRPMTPEHADILVSGQIRKEGATGVAKLDPQGQHLVCFAGGMFALGGKLFNIPAHVEIGKKITDGCIYTYKAMPLGIMPEIFRMVPCDSRLECEWDEKKWKEVVKSIDSTADTAEALIEKKRLPKGFTQLYDKRYILRPEAIESVFLLHRMTGEEYLLEAAWDMFTAIANFTRTDLANAALKDISYTAEEIAAGELIQADSMESFWMAETLKYFYLIFSEPDVISLDEWVFNTEAHPFKRQLPE
jgi:mannosyl-oligosaccharide alpha-1,2-mannosidase